jgi:hypothetical protein
LKLLFLSEQPGGQQDGADRTYGVIHVEGGNR